MDGLLYSISQPESIACISGLALLQFGLFYWIQKRTDIQSRKNYLKAVRNKTKNLVE